jgi:sigma-B regulation protein RsbU (phosphoserine phosphatase)
MRLLSATDPRPTPLQIDEAPARRGPRDVGDIIDATVSTVRLLLVEDNDGDAILIERLLRSATTRTPLRPTSVVHRVHRLAAASAHLAEGDADVVLLDLALPDASGLDALRTLRSAAPLVPIVVLTGDDDDELALAALRAGAEDFLVKDTVTGELILRAVRYAMERRRIRNAVARARWLAGVGETAIAVRHEVSNPLATLVAHVELLRADGNRAPEALAAILESTERIRDALGRLPSLDDPHAIEHRAGVPRQKSSPRS